MMEGHPEPAKRQGEFWVPLAVPRLRGGLHPASSSCLYCPTCLPGLLSPPLGTLEARLLPQDHHPGWAPAAFPWPVKGPLPGLQPPPPPCPLSLQTRQSSGNTPGNTTALHNHVQWHHACRTSIHLSVQFSHSVISNSAPHGLQHARPPCPSPTRGAHSKSCPLSQWCYPTISSSVIPFSSCLQSLPASGSFPMSQLLT